MGRRSQHNFDELSNMILETAQILLSEKGFANVSTRKIANSIGYSVGTLYNIFKNLDDIYIHLNGRTLDRIIDKLNKSLLKKRVSAIKSVSQAYLKFSLEEYHSWILLFEYKFPDDMVFPQWYDLKVRKLYDVVQNALAKVIKHPNVKINQHISVLWAGIHGICILSNKGKLKHINSLDPNLLIDDFIDNYLNGIIFNSN